MASYLTLEKRREEKRREEKKIKQERKQDRT